MMKALLSVRPAHVGQRRDLNCAALGMFLDFFGGQHVMQRILQRAQVWRDFFVKIARQKTQRFAGFDGGARQSNPRHLAVAQLASAIATARYVLPVPAGPTPNVTS